MVLIPEYLRTATDPSIEQYPLVPKLNSVLVSVAPGDDSDPIDVRVSSNDVHMVIVGQVFEIPEEIDRADFIFPYPECDPRPTRFLRETMTWQRMENAEAYSVGTGLKVEEEEIARLILQWKTWAGLFEQNPRSAHPDAISEEKEIAFIGINRQALVDVLCTVPDEGLVLAIPLMSGTKGSWRYSNAGPAIGTGSSGSAVMFTMLSPSSALKGDFRAPPGLEKAQHAAATKLVEEIGWVRRVLSHIGRVAGKVVRV